ncbi:uncharacterized protein [Oscarella lobularis]|uniref:uncharacterized protein n=1 Tax=Oscarella lobularis TaxID=121494 RepID=UPI0033141847
MTCCTGVWSTAVCEPSPSTRVFKTDCDGRTNCVFVTRTSTGPRWVKEITHPKSSCDKGLSGKPAPERTTIPTLEEAATRASHKGSRSRRGEQGLVGPRGPVRPVACYAGLPHSVTKATLNLPGNIRLTRSNLEIGPIQKSTTNKHIRFIVEGEGLGLHYSLHVRARCLPDPPSHLDEIGSVKDGYKSFSVFGDSLRRRRVHCLNINDTVTKCNRFVLTFIALALHRPGSPASLSLIPDGLYRACPRGTIDNP